MLGAMGAMLWGTGARAGVAFVLFAAVAMSGCGSEQPDGAARTADQVEAAADRLDEQIWGTPDQREAADYLAHRRVADRLSGCLAESGLVYERLYLPSMAGTRTNATASLWLGHLHESPSRRWVALSRARRAARADHAARWPDSVGDGLAWRRCGDGVEGLVDAGPQLPPETEQLSAAFTAMISAAEQNLPPIDGFTRCMAKFGIDLTGSDVEGATAVHLFLEGRHSSGRHSSPGADGWRDYLALEAKVLDADETCRGAERRLGLANLAPMLDEFADEHADALARNRAAWASIEAQAARVGLR